MAWPRLNSASPEPCTVSPVLSRSERFYAFFPWSVLAQLLDDGVHARHATFHTVADGIAAQIGPRHQVAVDVAGLDQGHFARSGKC